MAVVSMKQLLEAGVHFGHQTRRWNPKMKRFIFGERNGIYIIDLQQTLARIETAYTFVRDVTAKGGTVLFVGTKKQAQDPIEQYAEKCGMPFVNERWLGGMLTNFQTMSKRVAKMLELERQRDSGEFAAMPKKEALLKTRELDKLARYLGGIRSMEKLPQAVFVLDTKKEHIAVTEANKLGIPVVAVVDTNCDPDVIDYVIPGNDDAIRSGTLLCRVISDAVIEGKHIASLRATPVGAPLRATTRRASPPSRPRPAGSPPRVPAAREPRGGRSPAPAPPPRSRRSARSPWPSPSPRDRRGRGRGRRRHHARRRAEPAAGADASRRRDHRYRDAAAGPPTDRHDRHRHPGVLSPDGRLHRQGRTSPAPVHRRRHDGRQEGAHRDGR